MNQPALASSHEPTSVRYTDCTINSSHTRLFVRQWAPVDGAPRAHVLILHGYMDHGGRYDDVARYYAARGIASTAIDFRGHGRSEGQRGYIHRFDEYLDDVQAALALIDEPRFIVAHSNGALVALNYLVRRNPPSLAGVVVTNPFLAQTHPATGLKLAIGRLAGQHMERISLPSGLKSSDLTHDLARVEAHRRDRWKFTWANAGWFREVNKAQAEVRSYESVSTPLYYIYSDADPVASPAANAKLAKQLQSPDTKVEMCPGWYHEVFNEVGRETLYQHTADWILERTPRRT